MDLQTRKLNAIEYIAGLKDENIFDKIELTIFENKVRNDRKLKPFTQKQLLDRAEKSNKDYLASRYKTQETLEKGSESW
jgi:Asp-tRNA(Asn)/Glu-tRNA(Gln) amidotransferase C subunit